MSGEEKERRLKEELHRINTTANELAIEINLEKNASKQLQGQLAQAQQKIEWYEGEMKGERSKHEGEMAKLEAELEERKQMFEYNVKKNAEDRQDYKDRLAKLQTTQEEKLHHYREEIDRIKHELYESRKNAEVGNVRERNLEEGASRLREELKTSQEGKSKAESELQELRQRHE